jgi:hypothetical protein
MKMGKKEVGEAGSFPIKLSFIAYTIYSIS